MARTNSLILVAMALSVLLSMSFIQMAITGFNAADVSIEEKTKGSILMSYISDVNLISTQNITTEFINTGTVNYSAKIELTIYMYNNTTSNLEQLAAYQDNYAFLNPGDRKSFSAIFLPVKVGRYYVKARVPYDSKVDEMWSVFTVSYYFDMTPETKYVVTYYGGGTVPGQREFGVTGLELSYNDSIDTYAGQRVLFPIKLENTGTINLHNLKFYSSATDKINFEVSPKELYEFAPKESSLFLVSIEVLNNTPPGSYDFSFQILGLEAKRTGSITINVGHIADAKPIKDQVYNDIINYEYLITEVNYQIYQTQSKGFNTTNAELYLDNAKKGLQDAKRLYDDGNYEEASDILEMVRRDLERVVLNLADLPNKAYYYPAFNPYMILLLVIIILIALIIFIYLYKKRDKGRPKLIRAFTEEEGT